MKIPETLWQLLLEKEFTWFLTTSLVSVENTQAPSSADQPSDTIASELSKIEKNAVYDTPLVMSSEIFRVSTQNENQTN